MMYAQYCRLETKAGGVFATDREFIRACRSSIKRNYRGNRTQRKIRHKWIRSGLELKKKASQEYIDVMSGRCRG